MAGTARVASEATRKAKSVQLMEPIMKVDRSPRRTSFFGNVTGDLASRRGMILDTEDRGIVKVIQAEVPLSEMFGYTTALRGMSQGRASSAMEFAKYAPMPPNLQKEVIEAGA